MFRAAALAAFVLAAPLAGGALAASPKEQRTNFGALVVEQVVKEGPAGPGRATLHLRWTSADRRVSLDLIDDGKRMQTQLDARFCQVITHYLRYEQRPGEPRLRERLRGVVASMADGCMDVAEPERAAYRSEYELAEAGFPAAIEEMKRQALILFGGDLKRCRQARSRNDSVRTMLACERILQRPRAVDWAIAVATRFRSIARNGQW
jgi:hypothetical protein